MAALRLDSRLKAIGWVWVFGAIFTFAVPVQAQECTYSYGIWNPSLKRVGRIVRVTKSRVELTAGEIGPFGCTICKEDQVLLELSNGLRFHLCERIAGPVMSALEASIEEGYSIVEIVGYRPSMSRGPVNSRGERTVFSNHAFGVALDVNPQHNGLYSRCLQWGPQCQLIKGGAWKKGNPLSLHQEHSLVRRLLGLGFKWGGDIAGKQKDMMHFSPTGY